MAILTPEQQQQFSRQRLGLQSEAELNTRRLNEDYETTSRLLGEQRDRTSRDVGDQIASNGLFHSGIRIDAQGNVARQHDEQLSDITQVRTRGLEDISRGLSTGLADLDAGMAQALAEANRREQEENDRRAQLEATRQAGAVGGPGYPGAVIMPNAPAQTPWASPEELVRIDLLRRYPNMDPEKLEEAVRMRVAAMARQEAINSRNRYAGGTIQRGVGVY